MGDKSDSDNWLSDDEDKKRQKQENKNNQQPAQIKQRTQNVQQEQKQKETNSDQNQNQNIQHDQSCWVDNANDQNQNKQQGEYDKSQRGDVRENRGDIRTNKQQNNKEDVGENRYQGKNRNNQRYGNQQQNYTYRKDWRNQQNKRRDENRYRNNQNRENRNNDRLQNRNRHKNDNKQYNNDQRQTDRSYHNQRNDRNKRQQRRYQNKQKQQNQKCLIPNQNVITLPYQSIKLRGIQIRISYKKLLAQFHNFIVVPYQDQNLTLFPTSIINAQNNDMIKNRLNRKRQIWQGKQGVIIDLNQKTKQFDALFLLKLPNLKKGLEQFLNFFNQINKKIDSIALPFLGNDQNINQTSNTIIQFLFQNIKKWKKGNVSIISVVVQKPEQYIFLKKAFHIKVEQLIDNTE